MTAKKIQGKRQAIKFHAKNVGSALPHRVNGKAAGKPAGGRNPRAISALSCILHRVPVKGCRYCDASAILKAGAR